MTIMFDEKYKQLKDICIKYPDRIPIAELAGWLGCSERALRASIESGNCPFGFISKLEGKERAGYIIPTFTVWVWLTKEYGGQSVQKQ